MKKKTFLSFSVAFLSIIALSIIFQYSLSDLPFQARAGLFIFAIALIGWTLIPIDANLIALAATISMYLLGLYGDKQPLYALGDPFIPLLIAGFMLGGAYKHSGLSERIAHFFASKAQNVQHLFFLLTTILLFLSFVIPATSARAAIMLPVYLAIASGIDSSSIRRALALLFPMVIVLSCITSYMGAGANIMTADIIQRLCGVHLTYLDWLCIGMPIGIASCYLSTWVLIQIFLSPAERNQKLEINFLKSQENKQGGSKNRKKIMCLTIIMLGGWMTEPVHGMEAGTIALLGSLVLCMPSLGVISLKDGLKEVEWSLVIFMAATIEISDGLVSSGAIDYFMKAIRGNLQGSAPIMLIFVMLIISLLSHLIITSRTARVTALLPVLVPVALSAGQSGVLFAFMANAAMGYCLTLPASAKPVAMFAKTDEETYSGLDLLRLSMWLLPLHFALFLGFYYFFQNLGLGPRFPAGI